MDWFSEQCSQSFFCGDQYLAISNCTTFTTSNWRQDASTTRATAFNQAFSLNLLALALTVMTFVCAIIRCQYLPVRMPANEFFLNCSIVSAFILTLLSLILFAEILPEGYAKEKVNGLCVVPFAPSFYNKSIIIRNFETPCDTFIGELDWEDGTSFSWGGEGYWAALTATILFLITFALSCPTCLCCLERDDAFVSPAVSPSVVSVTSSILSPSPVSPVISASITPVVSPVISSSLAVAAQPSTFTAVEQFLIANELSEYIEQFRSNAFDWESFLSFASLTEKEQIRLVPQIGARMRLKTAIQKLLQYQQQQYQLQVQSQPQFQPQPQPQPQPQYQPQPQDQTTVPAYPFSQ